MVDPERFDRTSPHTIFISDASRSFSMRFQLLLLLSLLLTLPMSISGSWLGTLLFGKDTLEPVRNAIKQTEQLRDEVYGWYRHNATQQGNFTITPDPEELYRLLPANYAGRSLVDPDGAYYGDVKGWYKGEWTGWDYATRGNRSLALDSRLNRTAAEQLTHDKADTPEYVDGVNETRLAQDRGAFEWLSVKPGHLDMRLQEEHLLEGNVSLITGSVSYTSKPSGESVDFSLEGLHFIPTGSLFLHAIADEDPETTDVRTSLSLIPQENNQTANQIVEAIDKAFQLRIDMLQRIIDSGSYDGGADVELGERKHNCSLHVFGQFLSAGPYSSMQPAIDALESELSNSTGITTITPPPVQLSLLAYSPDCQLLLSSPDLSGLLHFRFWRKTLHYASIYFLVLVLQTYLLVIQMQATTTPSGLAKQSAPTWLIQSMIDAVSCLMHLSVAVGVENGVTKGLLACAFMSGVAFLAFGYRYCIVVLREQMGSEPFPTTATPITTPTVPRTAESNATEGASSGLLHRLTTSMTDTEAPAPTAEDLRARRRGATLITLGIFLFLLGFFPTLFMLLLLPILSSFWLPQIHRNVQRGTRRSVLKRTVIGLTCTRLFLPLYVLLCPDNVLFGEPSTWGWVLAVWMGVQAVVLVGQEVVGPHWFMREGWVPRGARGVVWEWHPEEREEGYGDCAICLTKIEIGQSEDKGSGRRRGWFDWSSYSQDYERLAEDFEVDDDDVPPQYPPEKSSASRHRNQRLRQPRPTTFSGRVLRHVRTYAAKAISAALRWKSNLNTTALRGRRTDVMRAPCQHAFHTECLERWLEIKSECPSCRSGLPPV